MKNAQPKKGFEWMGWMGPGDKKAPSFGVDMAACWVNNPRDMIMIQNAMWWYRDSWNNAMVPQLDSSGRRYWGWNEIPLDSANVNNPKNWDAVMIKLPAVICGHTGSDDSIRCLSRAAQQDLESNLDWHVKQKYIIPGVDNVVNRPGSYIVLLKEWWDQKTYSWSRGFYCEAWESPNHKYRIFYDAPSARDSTGVCFLEDGATPAPPPVRHCSRCDCNCNWARPSTCHHRDGSCCWDCCCHHHLGNSTDASTFV